MESGFVFYDEFTETALAGTGKNVATGASVGATAGSVVPGVGTAIGTAAGAATGLVVSLFGGGKGKNYGTGDCGEPLPGAVAEMLQNLPQAELSKLSSAYSSANKGKPLPNNSAEIAFAAYGGRDCKVTTSSGKAFKRIFDEQISKYGPGGQPPKAGAGLPSPSHETMAAAGIIAVTFIGGTILILKKSNKKAKA